jgi:hypothetical protein
MSSAPLPQSSGEKKFENSLEVIPLIKKLNEVRKFFKTRTAILRGEPLYLSSQDELKAQGYMGPWAFNVAQTLIDSLPGMMMSAALWVFFAVEETVQPVVADPVQAKLASWLSPLKGPLTLLTLVYAIAIAALPPGYLNRANWKAAARKYLYLDGAHGFWSQLLLASSIALLSIPSPALALDPGAQAIATVGLLGFVICFFWQGIITAWRIRSDMFEFDYLKDRPQMFSVVETPLTKFIVITGLGLPVLVGLINIAFALCTSLLAMIVHSLRR